MPLLTYKRVKGEEGAKLIPALAEAMPEVSEDGKTYTLTLREGLKYSDGSPVKANDFEYTIKRVINLESGGSSFYTGNIVGAEEYEKAGKAKGDISGITADDATRKITIKITEPSGQFPFILAMDFAGLVPGDTPFENQTKTRPRASVRSRSPSVARAAASCWRRTRTTPRSRVCPPRKLDKITINAVTQDSRAITDVLQNKADYFDDPPSSDALREFREQAPERYRGEVTNSTYYFFLNHRVKPFDNPRSARPSTSRSTSGRCASVRRPADAGLQLPAARHAGLQEDRSVPVRRPEGGAGHREGQADHPGGGRRRRERHGVRQRRGADAAVTEYLADVLEQIGLKPQLRIVNGDVYFQTIGNQNTKAAAGFANWFQDFPHPYNFMFLIDGVDPEHEQPELRQRRRREDQLHA